MPLISSLPQLPETQDTLGMFGFIQDLRKSLSRNPELLENIDPGIIAQTANILLSLVGSQVSDEERGLLLSGFIHLKVIEEVCKQNGIQVTRFAVSQDVRKTLSGYSFLDFSTFEQFGNYLQTEQKTKWTQSRCRVFLACVSEKSIFSQTQSTKQKEAFLRNFLWIESIRNMPWDKSMFQHFLSLLDTLGMKSRERTDIKHLFLGTPGAKSSMNIINQITSWHLGRYKTPEASGISSNLRNLAGKLPPASARRV